jgi:hypothetical protein
MAEEPFDTDTHTWKLGEGHWFFLTGVLLEELKRAYYYRKFNLPRPLGPRLMPDGSVEMFTVRDTSATYDSQVDWYVSLLRELHYPEDELAELPMNG